MRHRPAEGGKCGCIRHSWHIYSVRATVGSMHIPDGFLSTPVWLGFDAQCRRATLAWPRAALRNNWRKHVVPLLGVMGAFVFAAQIVNFPVAMGTSAHLLGGALLESCSVRRRPS